VKVSTAPSTRTLTVVDRILALSLNFQVHPCWWNTRSYFGSVLSHTSSPYLCCYCDPVVYRISLSAATVLQLRLQTEYKSPTCIWCCCCCCCCCSRL